MKSTYETTGGNYQPNGNYLMPDFEVPESPKVSVWGERRLPNGMGTADE